MRCVHEASLHDHNCFITLTYNEDNNPVSLRQSHFQKFMKRLRKYANRAKGDEILYFYCGEYGAEYSRPHFHACIFNFDFPDRELWEVRDGVALYRSSILERLWPFGFSTVGDVTFESAAYVARYVTKKLTGDAASDVYEKVDKYGEVVGLVPEYAHMSRRPAIAFEWFSKFKQDCNKDYLTLQGKNFRLPRAYDKLLHDHFYTRTVSGYVGPISKPIQLSDVSAGGFYDCLREARVKRAEPRILDSFKVGRVDAQREIFERKFKKLYRGYENDSSNL